MATNRETALYLTLASALVLGSSQAQAICWRAPCADEPWRNVFLNTYYGPSALSSVTTGGSNAAFGENALRFNTTAFGNTALGSNSLVFNTTGSDNTGSGRLTLYYNTTGIYNTAIGVKSLFQNTEGSGNTSSGAYSLTSNSTGNNNTASGFYSLNLNTTGIENTAAGYNSLNKNTTGNHNAAMGSWAMSNTTTGSYNAAQGDSALYNNTKGLGNVALGSKALYNNATGSYNTGIGELAGYLNATGENNVFIGRAAGLYETRSNKLYIASNALTPLLYGEFSETAGQNKLGIGIGTVAAGDTINVWNGAHLTTGGVWTNASSRELKDDIKPLSTEDAGAALDQLLPVRYVYRNSRDEEYVGFIAEDVPDLVATNDRKSLSPMDIVAVLTTVTKEQKAKMTEKEAEIAALRNVLAQQATVNLAQEAIIQKHDERMLQMEMALAEVQRSQSDEVQVSVAN